jgi:hypothetical protein
MMTKQELIEMLARMDTPTDGVESVEEQQDILAELSDDRLCGDAAALYNCIRIAREIVSKESSDDIR